MRVGVLGGKDDQRLVGVGEDHIFGRARLAGLLAAEHAVARLDALDQPLAVLPRLHPDAVAHGDQRILAPLLQQPPAHLAHALVRDTVRLARRRRLHIKVMPARPHHDPVRQIRRVALGLRFARASLARVAGKGILVLPVIAVGFR